MHLELMHFILFLTFLSGLSFSKDSIGLLYLLQTIFGGYIVILMSVRSSVHPSKSLIHYSKTAEQNFMTLSGIVHYMMPYCTSYLSFYSNDFGVSHSKTRTLPYKTWGSRARGYHFVSIAYSISSFHK